MAKKDFIIVVKESRHGNRMLQVDKQLWEDNKQRNANRGLRKAWQGFRELKENETIEIKTTTGSIELGKKKTAKVKDKDKSTDTGGALNNE